MTILSILIALFVLAALLVVLVILDPLLSDSGVLISPLALSKVRMIGI